MNEKTFLKKMIKKYSKKFEYSSLSGLNLNISKLESLRKEYQTFIEYELNSEYSKVDYNDDNYIEYYKTIILLEEYFKLKEKIYGNIKWNLRDPKGYKPYCPQRD